MIQIIITILPIITMHKISLVRSFPIHITAFENEIKCNWVDQYKKTIKISNV